MRCLRKTINVTRRDKVRNDTVRNQIGIESIQNYVERQQIKWFGHVIRMKPSETPHMALNARYSGARARGRPRKRWTDGIKEILERQNITLAEATHLALERRLHLPSTPS